MVSADFKKTIGVPIKKMPPKNEGDLVFKLTNTKFNSSKDLLNFFESNRDLFSESSQEPFKVIFSKLFSFNFNETKKNKSEVVLIEEPQFKNLIADYNKILGESVSEGHERFHEFMPIFESLMGLHRSKRFTK